MGPPITLYYHIVIEVGYGEMTGLVKMEERKRDEVRQRTGYQKFLKSCEQAEKGGCGSTLVASTSGAV